jgi:hypothetical protein
MKIRLVLQDVEVEWKTTGHRDDDRHPAALAFAQAAAPFVVDWLKKRGVIPFPSDPPPPASSERAPAEATAAAEDDHQADAATPNGAAAEV